MIEAIKVLLIYKSDWMTLIIFRMGVCRMFQGKRLADLILRDVGERILQENASTKPKLAAILIGSNPASKVYLMHKEKACSQVGIESEIIHMPERTTNRTAESVMQQFAKRDDVHGILLQERFRLRAL